MTATADLLRDPVEGQTHQLDTAPSGDGRTRWDLFVYARSAPERDPGWRQIATHVTDTPPSGYRGPGLGWLRSMGLDPDAMDLVLILPDGLERLRPSA